MRQRIVINLDSPQAGQAPRGQRSPARRRWPRVFAILALLGLFLVVVAAVGGFLLWRHYQSTPTYTLALMLDAAQRNDVAEFQKRIDDEEVTKNMAVNVSQRAAARYGYAFNSSIQQQIDTAMPSLLPRMKQVFQDECFKAFSAAPEQRSFISLVGVAQSLMTVTTENDSAKATGKIAGHNMEIAMRRDADRWKVIEVKDEVIVQRVVDSVMKELPAIGNIDPNSPLLKKPQRKRSGRGR